MQKMARDRFRLALKEQKAGVPPPPTQAEEIRLCMELGTALAAAKGDKKAEAAVWDEQWKTVYALAEAVRCGEVELTATLGEESQASGFARGHSVGRFVLP